MLTQRAMSGLTHCSKVVYVIIHTTVDDTETHPWSRASQDTMNRPGFVGGSNF